MLTLFAPVLPTTSCRSSPLARASGGKIHRGPGNGRCAGDSSRNPVWIQSWGTRLDLDSESLHPGPAGLSGCPAQALLLQFGPRDLAPMDRRGVSMPARIATAPVAAGSAVAGQAGKRLHWISFRSPGNPSQLASRSMSATIRDSSSIDSI